MRVRRYPTRTRQSNVNPPSNTTDRSACFTGLSSFVTGRQTGFCGRSDLAAPLAPTAEGSAGDRPSVREQTVWHARAKGGHGGASRGVSQGQSTAGPCVWVGTGSRWARRRGLTVCSAVCPVLVPLTRWWPLSRSELRRVGPAALLRRPAAAPLRTDRHRWPSTRICCRNATAPCSRPAACGTRIRWWPVGSASGGASARLREEAVAWSGWRVLDGRACRWCFPAASDSAKRMFPLLTWLLWRVLARRLRVCAPVGSGCCLNTPPHQTVCLSQPCAPPAGTLCRNRAAAFVPEASDYAAPSPERCRRHQNGPGRTTFREPARGGDVTIRRRSSIVQLVRPPGPAAAARSDIEVGPPRPARPRCRRCPRPDVIEPPFRAAVPRGCRQLAGHRTGGLAPAPRPWARRNDELTAAVSTTARRRIAHVGSADSLAMRPTVASRNLADLSISPSPTGFVSGVGP